MRKLLFTVCLAVLSFAALSFQSETLFTIEGESVSRQEFMYFYNKNSQNNPEANSVEDLESYLQLFIDFKLKVTDAKRLGYDTTAVFKNELDGYLSQLSESFMNKGDIENRLIDEAYERMKFDLDVSHILIRVSPDAGPKDSLTAYNKAMRIYNEALEGKSFESLAGTYSEEPGAKATKGRLGYFTVFQMVYPFESAAYSLPVNGISKPARTQFGYHIIKLNAKRPAMGLVEVAHIMVRFNSGMQKEDSVKSYEKIIGAYKELESGVPWDSVCMKYSEDLGSRQNGGKLRPFGVRGLNVPEFEIVANSTPVNDISKPFQTPFGWHIIKSLGKTTPGSFAEVREELIRRLRSDERSRLPEKLWISELKEKFDFNETTELQRHLRFLFDTVHVGSDSEFLFSVEEQSYLQSDLLTYANKQKVSDEKQALLVYNEFVKDKLIEKEEANLTASNHEYRMLKREYHDGILLFSIMEDKVWKRAEDDSTGLMRYYDNNPDLFQLTGALGTAIKVIPDSATQKAFEILLQAFDELEQEYDLSTIKKWARATLSSQSDLNLHFTEKVYPVGDPIWKESAPGINIINSASGSIILILNEKIETRVGEFDQVRGRVVAGYQEQLDNEWRNELHKKYRVKIKKKVLNGILNEIEDR